MDPCPPAGTWNPSWSAAAPQRVELPGFSWPWTPWSGWGRWSSAWDVWLADQWGRPKYLGIQSNNILLYDFWQASSWGLNTILWTWMSRRSIERRQTQQTSPWQALDGGGFSRWCDKEEAPHERSFFQHGVLEKALKNTMRVQAQCRISTFVQVAHLQLINCLSKEW